MSISVSERAKQHLEASLHGQGAKGIRLKVRKRGCAGYEYVLDFTNEIKETDRCFALGTFSLVVDNEQLDRFLTGTHIDYETKGLSTELTFHNPNVESQCGCGESFNLREKQLE